MADTTPKVWLCKHCNERVDPTMAMCWSCGYDKQGTPQQDLQVEIETELIVRPDSTSDLTRAMQQWSVLLRLCLGSWCVTGLFVMITGTKPLRNAYRDVRGPIDELVVVAFSLSVLLTLILIAHRLVYNGESVGITEPRLSSDLHRPWVRRWMVGGWGSLLFWFAWAWVLLNYL